MSSSTEPADASVYPHPALGYRLFRLSSERSELYSVVAQTPWQPPVTRARCITAWQHPDEPPPYEGCECGLYAYYTPDLAAAHYLHWKKSVLRPEELTRSEPMLLAVVLGRGETHLYAHGWRAAEARVCVLLDPSEWLSGDEGRLSEAELSLLSERYSAETVSGLSELRAAGERLAPPIPPPSLRVGALSDAELSETLRRYSEARSPQELQALSEELCSQFPDRGPLPIIHLGDVLQLALLTGSKSWRVLEDERRGDYSYQAVLDQLEL